MQKFTISLLVLFALFITGQNSHVQAQQPNGTLAKGHIEPVPAGSLYVGVLDRTLVSRESALVSGPPGFLLAESGTITLQGLAWPPSLPEGAALFLPAGASYRISNSASAPVRFRFLGLGGQGAVAGATYEMLPIPWGPGEGKAYDVQIDRSFFPGGSATPWHYHSGPAFGVLDSGTWENRQVDGSTVRIPTPGYYVQPANRLHQLAQVGSGGSVLIIQFSPPGQPLTGGGDGRGTSTPISLRQATPITAYSHPTADASAKPQVTSQVQPPAGGVATLSVPASTTPLHTSPTIPVVVTSHAPSPSPTQRLITAQASTPGVAVAASASAQATTAAPAGSPAQSSEQVPVVAATLLIVAVAGGGILLLRRR